MADNLLIGTISRFGILTTLIKTYMTLKHRQRPKVSLLQRQASINRTHPLQAIRLLHQAQAEAEEASAEAEEASAEVRHMEAQGLQDAQGVIHPSAVRPLVGLEEFPIHTDTCTRTAA